MTTALINDVKTKWAFTTRRVRRDHATGLSTDFAAAVPGDLILCRIVKIGQHKKIQLSTGRSSESYVGDHVVLCVGDRYAPDQFEGRAEIDPEGCDLIAGGGITGTVRLSHAKMSAPTKLEPLGLLTDRGGDVLNIASYALPDQKPQRPVKILAVFGTSMNAGKTTAAACLAHGLSRAGFKVAGVKVTGTGAFGDYNAFEDAGIPIKDFVDAGMPTTYKMPLHRIERGFDALVADAADDGAEIVVMEFADGVLQKEAKEILAGGHILDSLDGVLFAAGDSAGAIGGVKTLREHGVEPFAISGLVSCSPLSSAEAVEELELPVLSKHELCDPEALKPVLGNLMRRSASIIPLREEKSEERLTDAA
jgi:hypothetical protein